MCVCRKEGGSRKRAPSCHQTTHLCFLNLFFARGSLTHMVSENRLPSGEEKWLPPGIRNMFGEVCPPCESQGATEGFE